MFGPVVSHVTIGTRDLDGAIALLRRYGLVEQRYPGGACLPVGPVQYIEVQQADPAGRPLQQWLHSVVDDAHRWCGWSIAVPDLEFAGEANLAVTAVDQTTAGSGFAAWSFEVAGGNGMRSSRGVAPYFIRYGHDAVRHEEVLRGRVGGELPDGLDGIQSLLVGDPDNVLESWLAPVGGVPAGVQIDDGAARGIIGLAIARANEVVDIDLSGG